MQLPGYVRPFPKFTNPFGVKAVTLFALGSVFLKKEIYHDLMSSKPNPVSVSLLLHEEEHRKNRGWKTTFKYLVFPKFRIQEESNAYRVMFAYLKKHNQTYDLTRIARAFSSPAYLWSMPEEKALKFLEELWSEA